jgi:segregation and condensation protein B
MHDEAAGRPGEGDQAAGQEPAELGPEPPEPDRGAPAAGLDQDGLEEDGLEEDGLDEDGLDEDGQDGAAVPSLRACLEAILLVADEPVSENLFAQLTERPTGEVAAELRDLAAAYTAGQRGFELREVAGGWRLYTRADCAAVVARFVSDSQEVRLTQAALETLAVVAYRQPVSRARVSAVRGVNCDGVIRTLVLRGLIEETGNDAETGAALFRTTSYFLERLGLPSLTELPELAPFLPDQVDEELDRSHDRGR